MNQKERDCLFCSGKPGNIQYLCHSIWHTSVDKALAVLITVRQF